MKQESILVLLVYIFNFLHCSRGLVLDAEPTIEGLDNRLTKIEAENVALRKLVDDLQNCASDICEIHWRMWSEWTMWSHCTGQCQGGYNTRHQSRSRIRTCNVDDPQSQLCQGDKSQQETRPCSAVELHGCLNERTTNVSGDNVYGVVYNFMDEMAMATCAAIVNTSYVISAVRRNCYSNHAPLCTDICQNLPSTDPTRSYSCFETLHVTKPTTLLHPGATDVDEGRLGLSIKRYNTCTYGHAGHCGPNYCCCKKIG